MTDIEFYQILDSELISIIVEAEKKCLPLPKKLEQKKAFALLIWVLKFYGYVENYSEFITDGHDDCSCDIILNRKSSIGEDVYYVIQSKWNIIDRVSSVFDVKDIKQAINDFETILAGTKGRTKNLKFDQKNKELFRHIARNGRVNFLFIGLCQTPEQVNDNVIAFAQKYRPKINLDIIDINRIKRDYIERVYKDVVLVNPLDFNYRPEDFPITIKIERKNITNRDVLVYNESNDGYVFLISPKTVYNLFKTYGFQLFYKNIRNPLVQSNYNENIARTLLNFPSRFWYFNNGVTGITETEVELGVGAMEVKLDNLQIINGAQTVFTIYDTYNKATKKERENIDRNAKIIFRLIVSRDVNFIKSVTQFTNSQNPLLPSDFCANDAIQERLQIESYKYNLWYEKRRGEFRCKPDSITIIDKETMASIFLACHLEEPILAISNKQNHFISQKDGDNGLYEFIFNEKTSYKDMIASFRLFKINIISTYSKQGVDYPPDDRTLMPFLTLSKIVLRNCFAIKFGDDRFEINSYINKHYEDAAFIEQHSLVRTFVAKKVFNEFFLGLDLDISQDNFKRFYSDKHFFDKIKSWFHSMELGFEKVADYNNSTPVKSLNAKIGKDL